MDDAELRDNEVLAYGAEAADVDVAPAAGVLNPPATQSAATAPAAQAKKPDPAVTLFEPAPDKDSVVEFGTDLEQRAPQAIPGIATKVAPSTAFGMLEVRQGYLDNCPLPAVLVAMAHVDDGRDAASRRIPGMVSFEDKGEGKQYSQREVAQTEQEITSKIPPAGPFSSRWVAKVRFSDRTKAERVTLVLYWNDNKARLHYAWATTKSLGPSLIEKAYLLELKQPRDYFDLASKGLLAPELKEEDRIAFAQGITDERAQTASGALVYDRLINLAGLIVMIDLTGSGTEFLGIPGMGAPALLKILQRHSTKVTIAGSLSDDQVAPPKEGQTAARYLVEKHYYAVVGQVRGIPDYKPGEEPDPNAKEPPPAPKETDLVVLVDALGKPQDRRDPNVLRIPLADFQREVGEIIQEV